LPHWRIHCYSSATACLAAVQRTGNVADRNLEVPFADRNACDLTELAIVLDGVVYSAPRINSRITNSGIIEGRFSMDEARKLAIVLRSGALPATMTVLEERTVGPSLVADSINQGLIATAEATARVLISRGPTGR
jgi:preprotein translocase subunit SecD